MSAPLQHMGVEPGQNAVVQSGYPTKSEGARLFLYDSACAAVAAAISVDEVLELNSRAEAVRAYAKQARNRDLEIQATEIRIRALRRLGQLLNSIRIDGSIEPGASPKEMSQRRWKRVLASKEIGVNQNLAIKALKAAALTDEQYERLISGWRQRCLEENKIYLTLEPRLARSENSQTEDTAPITEFDTYSLDPFGSVPIGDLEIHRVEDHIEGIKGDLKDVVRELNIRLLILINIRDHFGGTVAPRRDGSPVLLREALSEKKLREFIADANQIAEGDA